MKRVLFPTDFSESSLTALSYVVPFCEKINAELVLFNAMSAPVIHPDEPIIQPNEIVNSQKERTEIKLKEIALNLSEKYRIPVKFRAEFGFSADTISNVAKEENALLIALSAKGESNVFDTIFGNVTLDLFKISPVPVLSIPKNATFTSIQKVVFASSDITNDSDEIYDVMELTNSFNATIKLIHIVREEAYSQVPFNSYKNVEFIEIIGEDKTQLLLNYLEENDIDMVCIKKYKLPFFYQIFHKSFTEELFYHSKTPLLVFGGE